MLSVILLYKLFKVPSKLYLLPLLLEFILNFLKDYLSKYMQNLKAYFL